MGGRLRVSVVILILFVFSSFSAGWRISNDKIVRWVVWGSLPSTFDPYVNSVARGRLDINAMFSSLYDIRGESFGPQLARKMICRQDRCKIYLRKNVYFHDGHLVTASDVAFSLKKAMHMKDYRAILMRKKINRVVVESDFVLSIFCSRFPVDLKMLLTFPVVPKFWYEDKRRYREFCRHPIGSGPFEFYSVSLPNKIIVRKFDKFFLGCPKIDRMEFCFFSSNKMNEMNVLLRTSDIVTFVPLAIADLVEKLPYYKKYENDTPYMYSLIFSLRKGSVFRSNIVRRALKFFISGNKTEAEALLRSIGWRKISGRWVDMGGKFLKVRVFSLALLIGIKKFQRLRLRLMEEGIDISLVRDKEKANAYLVCFPKSLWGAQDNSQRLFRDHLFDMLENMGEDDLLQKIMDSVTMEQFIYPVFPFSEVHLYRSDLVVEIGHMSVFSSPWLMFLMERKSLNRKEVI